MLFSICLELDGCTIEQPNNRLLENDIYRYYRLASVKHVVTLFTPKDIYVLAYLCTSALNTKMTESLESDCLTLFMKIHKYTFISISKQLSVANSLLFYEGMTVHEL